MANASETKQPTLSSRLLVEGDNELVALVKELDRLHGAAVVLQDEKGRNVPVRINTSTLGVEVYRGAAWVAAGQQTAPAAAQSQNTVVIGGTSTGGNIQDGPVFIDNALTVTGTTTLNGAVALNGTTAITGTLTTGPMAYIGGAYISAAIVFTPEVDGDTYYLVNPENKSSDPSKATFSMTGQGAMSWGAGSSSLDTFLSRDSAGVLKTTGAFTITGNLSVGGNVILPTSGGTQIGTATDQLLGFYGATPVNQPETIADPSGGATVDSEARTAINALIDRLQELGLIA